MAMAIKKMQKPTINLPEVPEYTSSRVDIFIWGGEYKETKRKETNLEESNKKT